MDKIVGKHHLSNYLRGKRISICSKTINKIELEAKKSFPKEN